MSGYFCRNYQTLEKHEIAGEEGNDIRLGGYEFCAEDSERTCYDGLEGYEC